MEIPARLCNESHRDDQVLETDMMRFMAIIGIVFWIIFALIKSIPFHHPDGAAEPETPGSYPDQPCQPLQMLHTSKQTSKIPELFNRR